MAPGLRPELKTAALLQLACAYAVATNGTIVMPVIVATLMRRFGIGEDAATGLAGLEIVGIAIACAVLPRWVAGAARRFAAVGCLGTLLAQAAGAWLPSAGCVGVSRGIVGLFEGMLFVVVAASLSHRAAAERGWGVIMLVGGVFDAVLLVVAASLPGPWVDRWLFLLLAGAFALIAVPAARTGAHALPRPVASATRNPPRRWRTLLPIWAVMVLAYAVLAAQWAVAELVGSRIGLTAARIGLLLSLASVLGLAGCLAAAHRRSHDHRTPIVCAALLTMAASVVGFFVAQGSAAYFATQALVSLAFYALTPFLTARLSELDADGALVARSIVVCFAGAALGTAFAGTLLGTLGGPGFGAALALASLLALPFAWRAFARPALVAFNP
ncbi:MFS transporter [Aquabacterium sp.]|uniref:MFS transporter n=1 Tax=Aquabacterium sp. TaxID=1872578 RepID=UPI0037849D3D